MREKNGVLILENLQEEDDFRGMLLTKRPHTMGQVDILEITSRSKKAIGEMDTIDLYGGRNIKDKVKKIFPNKNVSNIAISDNLSFVFDV